MQKLRTAIRVAAVLVLAALALIPLAAWYVWCDWVPDETVAHLPSASRAEVVQLLGEPDDSVGSREQPGAWKYRRPWRMAEFQIYFDSSGRVEWWCYDR